MKAYQDSKAIYISDLIKQNHNKRRIKQLRVYSLITYILCKYKRETNNKAQI